MYEQAAGRPFDRPVGAQKAGPWSKKIRKLEKRRKRQEMKGKVDGPDLHMPVRTIRHAPVDSDESEAELEQLKK